MSFVEKRVSLVFNFIDRGISEIYILFGGLYFRNEGELDNFELLVGI